jgi:hypothetical protein
MLIQQPVKMEDASDDEYAVPPNDLLTPSSYDQLLKDIKKEDPDSWYCY